MNNISNIGAIYRKTNSSGVNFLGTCFSFSSADLFVTAAHCVKDIPLNELIINHMGGQPPKLFTEVNSVHLIPEGDAAILKTDAPGAKWVKPFKKVQYVAGFGLPVCAFGYPEDMMDENPSKPTLRFFRGNIQRPFLFRKPGCKKYSAFELSFVAPPGLSGGPVFLQDDPTIVIGIVTDNFETYSLIDEYEERNSTDEVIKVQTRKIISYGVATNMQYLAEEYKNITGEEIPAKVDFSG